MSYFTLLWTSSGYTGSPGYTKLHFLQNTGSLPTGADVNAAAAAGRSLISSLVAYYPTGVKYAFQGPAQVFDDSGELQGEVAVSSPPADVVGTGGTSYPGGVGAVVFWNTLAINGGHKVKGRTYFVPLATGAFAADGTLQATLVTNLQNAANAFVGSFPPPVVNSRKLDQADRVDGTYTVVGATVKDRTAFLRSRRT